MPYIVDGHNLIGQMASLRLNDPDDEAKLVLILDRFALRRRLRVVVYFDRGRPGQNQLGTPQVSVVFARSPEDADTKIAARLRRLVTPREWVLVSSDRALIAVAEQVGSRVIRATAFAETLAAMDAPPEPDASHAAIHAHVKVDALGEWLDVFGVEATDAAKPVDLQRKPKGAAPVPRKRKPTAQTPPPATTRRRIVGRLPEGVETPLESLEQVSDQPNATQPASRRRTKADPIPREADGRIRRSRGGPHPVSSEGERLHKPPPPVHPDEVAEWLEFFGADEDE